MQRICSVALVLASLVAASECVCSRRYSSPRPDCSAARLSDGRLSDTHIPCLAAAPDGSPQQLEFPEDNAQTCYRTCIDAELGQCQAALVSSIHNRGLVVGADFKLWVFSQGFQRTTNQKYRKSSICRYKVKCAEGKILSYSIASHRLEEPASCGTSGMACPDSLTLSFPGMASSQTSCGTQDVSPTNSDGSSELLLEFMSNRAKELNGFLLLAWCVDPTIKEESQASSRESRGAKSGQTLGRRCSSTGYGKKNESASLQQLANAFPAHGRKILAPSAVHITVDVFGHVSFKNRTIFITHRNKSVTEFPRIAAFHLSNRILNESVFWLSAPGRYHGYGYIVIWRAQAFFLQAGINPEFRPTEEEQKLIEEFQSGLREAAITKLSSGWEWVEEEESGSGGAEQGSGEGGKGRKTGSGEGEKGGKQKLVQTEIDIPSKKPVTNSSSWEPTTSESPSSSWEPTTAESPSSSWEPTTVESPSSWEPTTVESPSSSWEPTTAESPSSSWEPTTAESPSSSWEPTTAESPSSWEPTTAESPSSWEPTTAESPSSSWESTTAESPSSWEPTTAERILLAKARQYSTACNALLRSVACAYLKLVAGQDCPSPPGLASTPSGWEP